MSTVVPFKAIARSLALAFFATALVGCSCRCPSTALFVAVREEQFRSSEHALPLAPEARADLLLFLAAGGNRMSIEDGALVDVVHLDAQERWGPVLEMLALPEFLDVADLRSTAYAKWFEGEPLSNVIDAREQMPRLVGVHALRDEHFHWIFEGDGTRLHSLFLQRDYSALREDLR